MIYCDVQRFELVSDFKPAGDQPRAIADLEEGLRDGRKNQVLLGVTGSGKTFTLANVIERVNRPTLVLSPNKVLAAQLYGEFKSFFPKNAVEYFISYYDYYQPEAYVPSTDTYIEKDASINQHIDKLRLKATTSLLSRRDCIIVASVSCIYNIGSPENFKSSMVQLEEGSVADRKKLTGDLVAIHYERNETDFARGKFRFKGNFVDVFPSDSDTAIRVELSGDRVKSLHRLHPLTGERLGRMEAAWISPAKHFVTSKPAMQGALAAIEAELTERVGWFNDHKKPLEAQRIEQRTRYDMEMLREMGFCHGIENYSRPLTGRPPGARPFCLIDYFPEDFLTVVDESHVTVPQIGGMYEGDRARKQTLIDFGFRLPSALDNRPLKFDEFEKLVKQTIFISATPRPFELKKAGGVIAEQVIRPTGLVDPPMILHPTEGQIDDLIERIERRVKTGERALVTTLTKRTAEDLAAFLQGKGLKVRYLHSDIDSLTRIEILKDLRKGAFDVLVGINLLREGLDLPEVSLVAILDADNEGFLRSETTLIQISGRAARNVGGEVVLYADKSTDSMKKAMGEMDRRRTRQLAYNVEHKITPQTIVRAVHELEEFQVMAKKEGLAEMVRDATVRPLNRKNLPHMLSELDRQMREAADNLDFELAAVLRDQIVELKEMTGYKKGSNPPPFSSKGRSGPKGR